MGPPALPGDLRSHAPPPARSTNHLGHFLLCNLLLEDLKNAPKNNPAGAPRMVIVGSITGNTNTLAGALCLRLQPPPQHARALRHRT